MLKLYCCRKLRGVNLAETIHIFYFIFVALLLLSAKSDLMLVSQQ